MDSLTVLSIHLHKKKFSTIFLLLTIDLTWTGPIEERWRKKPRQTDVVVFWRKITTNTCFYSDCVADELIKGGQGQKCGGIFVYYIFLI